MPATLRPLFAAALVLAVGCAGAGRLTGRDRVATATAERREFVRSVRVHGTVQAVRSAVVSVPRLAGPGLTSLLITRLARSGRPIRQGDVVVEFDRQAQMQTAFDRRADHRDLEEQIRQRQATQAATRASDERALKEAENAVEHARLEMLKNELLPAIQGEKNQLALESATARLARLRDTFDLKRQAAVAELRILEIQRDRALEAARYAEANAEKMRVTAPLDGLVVVRTMYRSGGGMTEIQEGEEVRAGIPVLDVVDTAAMEVRARVGQADISDVRVGLPVTVRLDAYPEQVFPGRVKLIGPMAVSSAFSETVRAFAVTISIDGTSPTLTPDLSAAVDIELARVADAVVVPRDAIGRDGDRAFVVAEERGRLVERDVTLGETSDHETVVASGLEPGAVVARHVAAGRTGR